MCCSLPQDHEFVMAPYCVGTLGYIAPEVLSKGRYSKRSDLFALGVLIHYCATKQSPGQWTAADDVRAWCAQQQQELTEGFGLFAAKPPEFNEALKSLLHAAPEDRPDRVETFADCAWIGWGKRRRRTSKKKDDMMQRLLKE